MFKNQNKKKNNYPINKNIVSDMVRVQVIKKFKDKENNEKVRKIDDYYETKKERAKELELLGYVKVIDESTKDDENENHDDEAAKDNENENHDDESTKDDESENHDDESTKDDESENHDDESTKDDENENHDDEAAKDDENENHDDEAAKDNENENPNE